MQDLLKGIEAPSWAIAMAAVAIFLLIAALFWRLVSRLRSIRISRDGAELGFGDGPRHD